MEPIASLAKATSAGALDGLRVLECGDFVAAPYAASLLGHLGAQVIKVEPAEGDSNRRRGPFSAGVAHPQAGGLHLYLDQAKRGIVLDLASATDRAALRRLSADADALIVSGAPDLIARRGLTYAALQDANPRLVVTTITAFGIDADRHRSLPMRDICDSAAGGWLWHSPGLQTDRSLPPLKPFGQQTHFQAGVQAALATLGALAERDVSGLGQHVDVSVQATIAGQVDLSATTYQYSGMMPSRFGVRRVGPWGPVTLGDGTLFLICFTEIEWQRLVEVLGTPPWTCRPEFTTRPQRGERNDELLVLLASTFAGQALNDVYRQLQQARVPCAPIYEMPNLLRNEHFAARGFFQTVDHPIAGAWVFPGAQWQFSATPWRVGRRAPLLGEHQALVASGPWPVDSGGPRPHVTGHRPQEESGPNTSRATDHTRSTVHGPQSTDVPLPLAGVRVADFSWVWAGPCCAMQLAHLGADVIKVESASRLDSLRPGTWQGVQGHNRGSVFNQVNQGKRSITLDLKHADGLRLARDLIACSDIVIDNFGGGAMDRMGLGYATLRSLKPDIIQISLSGHGQTGPAAAFVAYGPTQVAQIGLSSLTGYGGGGPAEVGAYGDPNGGFHGAVAVLAALRHHRRTGEGQYIDMSQWEAATPLVVEGLLSYQMNGRQPPRMGSRDEFEAPQGVFRCAGDDHWVAVSCWSNDEWRALARVIGRPDLQADPALATAAGRKAREDELEAAIANWTALRTRAQATTLLTDAGVPAHPVLTAAEVLSEPVLAQRKHWVRLPHPECTGAQHAGVPWRFSRTSLQVRRAAPCLGQHTDEVLAEVLGLDPAAIGRLDDAGVLR